MPTTSESLAQVSPQQDQERIFRYAYKKIKKCPYLGKGTEFPPMYDRDQNELGDIPQESEKQKELGERIAVFLLMLELHDRRYNRMSGHRLAHFRGCIYKILGYASDLDPSKNGQRTIILES